MNRIVKEDIDRILNEKFPWKEISNRKILITGSTGHLMTYLIHTLVVAIREFHLETQLYCLCRNSDKAQHKFGDIMDDKHIQFIYGDVCDKICYPVVDIIIHAASPANPTIWNEAPVDTLDANILGTINLLNVANDYKAQFIFVSSSAVYGSIDIPIKLSEDDRGDICFNDFRYAYNVGKRTGEALCKCYEKQFGIDVKIIRPFIVYGPGMEYKSKKAFTDFLYNVINKQDIVLKSDGHVMRSYCYIADAISGFLMVIFRGVSGEAYNVANADEDISILQLANAFAYNSKENARVIFDLTQDSDKTYLKSISDSLLANTNKLKLLGWEAKSDINDGIRRTIISCEEECEI